MGNIFDIIAIEFFHYYIYHRPSNDNKARVSSGAGYIRAIVDKEKPWLVKSFTAKTNAL